MSAALAPSPVERTLRRRPTARPERPTPRTAWSSEGVHRVGIVASDPDSAALLLEYASRLFSVELITGPELIVRLQPPSTEAGWVIEPPPHAGHRRLWLTARRIARAGLSETQKPHEQAILGYTAIGKQMAQRRADALGPA